MKLSNLDLAKAIDFINEFVFQYYYRDMEEKPDPIIIQSELWKKKKINHEVFEVAMRIMQDEGYIEYIFNDKEDKTIRELKSTPKGWYSILTEVSLSSIVKNRIKTDYS